MGDPVIITSGSREMQGSSGRDVNGVYSFMLSFSLVTTKVSTAGASPSSEERPKEPVAPSEATLS